MIKQFLRDVAGFETDTLAELGKKVSVPAAAVGILLANIVNQFLNPLVLGMILFVLVMMVMDMATGFIYHVYLKEPPDKFDKKKIFVSFFQFGLLIGIIVAMVFFKIAIIAAEQTSLAWLVPTLDGGISGLFVSFLLIIGLVLLYDFAQRGKEMGMPGAGTLMVWLKGLINRTAKTDDHE